MAQPNSKETLKQYCLRQLGQPLIEVNVDPTQVDDRIDDALQYVQEFHMEGSERTYLKHQLTATDLTNQYIPVDSSIQNVIRILPLSRGLTSGMFSAKYQLYLNDIYGLHANFAKTDAVTNYVMTRQYLALIDQEFNGYPRIRFSRHINKIMLDINWETELALDQWLIFEVNKIIDPELHTELYNDIFLKQYATALIKQQWGLNLIKFSGMQLPGGTELNGETILSEAKEDIERLEEEMRLTYEAPVDFFTG